MVYLGPITPKPTVGRIVHYRSHGTPGGEHPPACRAAIVADVYTDEHPPTDPECLPGIEGSEWVALAVLNPTGIFFNDVCHDELTKLGGTWHWPEREEG